MNRLNRQIVACVGRSRKETHKTLQIHLQDIVVSEEHTAVALIGTLQSRLKEQKCLACACFTVHATESVGREDSPDIVGQHAGHELLGLAAEHRGSYRPQLREIRDETRQRVACAGLAYRVKSGIKRDLPRHDYLLYQIRKRKGRQQARALSAPAPGIPDFWRDRTQPYGIGDIYIITVLLTIMQHGELLIPILA